jgi:hypothetical protein
MWVMHVERVEGEYIEPEIIDLEDGTGCLFRLHESDISRDGPEWLSELLTDQAQRWAPRPAGDPPGPVISVTWLCLPGLPDRFAFGVEDYTHSIIYTVDSSLLSQRAGDYLARLDTQRSPYWQRVPEGYHNGDGDSV